MLTVGRKPSFEPDVLASFYLGLLVAFILTLIIAKSYAYFLPSSIIKLCLHSKSSLNVSLDGSQRGDLWQEGTKAPRYANRKSIRQGELSSHAKQVVEGITQNNNSHSASRDH